MSSVIGAVMGLLHHTPLDHHDNDKSERENIQ